MPVWLQIVIAVFGLISTVFGIFGISAYISERAKHKAAKQNEKEDAEEARKAEEQRKLEEMKHAEYKAELVSIIRAEFAPIAEKLENIETDLGKVKRGVQVNCRNDLEDIVAKAEKQKYLSLYDKKRFESAYLAYHELGKNGVMDAIRERIMNMDETKPPVKRKSKKKVLLEDK